MSRPKSSEAYPLVMLDAMRKAFDEGELIIPVENPAALRLQFYGLGGALRKEGKSELFDALSFILADHPPRLIIRIRENSAFAKAIEKALGSQPAILDAQKAAEAALARILGE